MKQEIDKKDLVRYAEILNNYENGNYKLSDEEFDFVKQLTKVRVEYPSINKDIDKIKDMARSQRKKYIEEYKSQKENKLSKETTTKQLAETFDVAEKNIKEETLKDGKTLYVLYSEKLGRNIVLEDGANNKNLLDEINELKEKNIEKDDTIDDNYEELIDDKILNQNLEVSFVPINELNNYMSTIKDLSPNKIDELDCIVKNAASLNIEYINLDNIVGLDKQGKIFEAYYDSDAKEYKISGTKDDLIEESVEDKDNNIGAIIDDEDLESMLNEKKSEQDEINNDKELENSKVLVKEYNETKNNNKEETEEE